MRHRLAWLALTMGCGPALSGPDNQADGGAGVHLTDAGALPDLYHAPADDSGAAGGGDSYTVYAHGNHILYQIDLQASTLVTVGPFNAPKVNNAEDTITDLAVAPDGTIYVNSGTNLYTADPHDGHVTLVTSLGKCGGYVVALSFTLDGQLMSGDSTGDYCKIDPSAHPATVTKVGTLGGGMALAGDIVAVADGTMYGTAIQTGTASTKTNNILVELDPATGKVKKQIGPTGFPDLFGAAFALGQVFGFTHDGSGRVITIDPATGKGTLFGTFSDPATGMGISFAGAGVNPMVRGVN